MTSFVLDNSVSMRWCFENATHAYADSLLTRLEAGEGAAAGMLCPLRVALSDVRSCPEHRYFYA